MDSLPPPPLPPAPPPFPSGSWTPPPPSSRQGPRLWILLAVVLCAGAGLWVYQKIRSRVLYQAESVAEREAGIRAAFQGPVSPVALTSPEAVEIDAMLRRMLSAWQTKDKKAFAALLDGAAMVRAGAEQTGLPEIRKFAAAAERNPGPITTGLANGMLMSAGLVDYVDVCLRRLEISADGTQAQAWTIWKSGDHSQSRERLWLRKVGSDWRMWDMELLEMGIRTSTIMSTALSDPTLRGKPNGTGDLAAFLKLVESLTGGDLEAVKEQLPDFRKSAIGRMLPGMADFLEASVLITDEDYAGGREILDRMGPPSDRPILHLMRAWCHAGLEEHREAIASAAQFVDFFGDDPDALLVLATSHEALGEKVEAKGYALRVLTEIPEHGDALVLFARQATAEDVPRLAEIVSKAEDPEDSLDTLLYTLETAEAFSAAAAAAEKVAPDSEYSASLRSAAMVRTVWQEASADPGRTVEVLGGKLAGGTEEEFTELCDGLRSYLIGEMDGPGLGSLAESVEKARPGHVLAITLRGDAEAIPFIGKWTDEDTIPPDALETALSESKQPDGFARSLVSFHSDIGDYDTAAGIAAAFRSAHPDSPMNAELEEMTEMGAVETTDDEDRMEEPDSAEAADGQDPFAR